MNTELAPEESAYIDRLLEETADADDMEVDYDGMLRAIKAKAREEGIVIFPASPRRPRFSAKKVIAALSATAAVLAMGLGILLMSKTAIKSTAPSADAEPAGTTAQEAYATNKTQLTAAATHDAQKTPDSVPGTPSSEAPMPTSRSATEDPAGPTAEPDPAFSEIAPSITDITENIITMPTGYPIRGGRVDYLLIAAFYAEPENAEQLIPEALPDDMPVKESPDELMVYAASMTAEKHESVRFYSCRITDERDYDLEVGVARCKTGIDGSLEMLWRVTEETWLSVEFKGIEAEFAEQLLTTLPLACSPYSQTDENDAA